MSINQSIQDMNEEPQVRHSTSVFAIVKNEHGEEKEVDLEDIVGSEGKNKKENK